MPLGDETISYNKEESVAVYRGSDGSFNLLDYGKVQSRSILQYNVMYSKILTNGFQFQWQTPTLL